MAEALAHPVDFDPQPLPEAISTPQDEYFPSLWLAGDGLVFTRRVGDLRHAQGQEDLYVSVKEQGEWTEAQPMRGLNTRNNEGAASLSGDGRLLCFTVCRDADRPGEETTRAVVTCMSAVGMRKAAGSDRSTWAK